MSDSRMRALAALLASAVCAPECFAQAASTTSRDAAIAEVRKGLQACEALSEWNRQKKRCVSECSNAVKAIPITNPDWTPRYVAGCNQLLKMAQATEEKDAAVEAKKAEQKKLAQVRAAEQAAAAKAAAAAEAAAAPKAPADSTPAPRPVAVTAASSSAPASPGKIALRTEGAIDWGEFENEISFYKVFNGEFGTYHKGSLGVRALMTYYLQGFQSACAEYLPADAVTMVRKTFLVSENSLGIEERELIGTDEITMAPRFVYGYENYPSGAGIGAFVDVKRPDRMVKDAIDFLKTWQKDTRLLFSVEACQGPAMLQLGENIARVTSGRPPIQSEPNAAQILANLRVAVPKNVEDADVRTKRAKADAWWSAQRATWGKPPQVQEQNDQYGRGNWIRVNYETIAPDFQVPIPSQRPDQIVEISVEKAYNRRIRSIQVGFQTLSPYDVSQFGPVNAETYRKDTQAAYEEGARILKCTYDAGGTLNTVDYWFRKNPQSINLEASRTTWDKHPLLKVRNARNDCPVTMP